MLLANPLASPIWPTLGWTFFGVFGGSLVALLVAVRGRWSQLAGSVLFERWRTWLLIAPLFSLAALAGPIAMAALATALSLQASREYAPLAALPTWDRRLLMLGAVVIPVSSLWVSPSYLTMAALLLATIPALLQQDVEHGAQRVARLAFGLCYVPVALSLLVLIERDPRGGPGTLLALALATALSDVGAFTLGKLFGRRHLASRLSPSKTLAGAAGNVLGAALGIVLLRQGVPQAAILLAPAVALGAVWGDLLESLLKRGAGAKDAGSWLPGFGGLLDRIDSLLVVLPLATFALQVLA
jgi:phosphatidate cytidylyltransferase